MALMLVAAIATSGLLRSFHAGTPRWPLLPESISSLLFTAFALLLALHLRWRPRGLDLWSDPPRPSEPTLAQLLPIVVVLLGEKWITGDLLRGTYEWIWSSVAEPRLNDPLYRLWSGLGLLGAALVLLPVLRQIYSRLAVFTGAARLATAIRLGGIAWAVTTVFVLVSGKLAGGRLGLPAAGPLVLAVAVSAQIVRGVAEEFFYRGMLQTALVRILVRAGLPERRLARLTAIGAISASFTLEHVDPALSVQGNLRPLLFVFAMSAALGLLLEVSRNLYLVMLTHTALNLVLGHLLPTFIDVTGRPVLSSTASGAVFVFVVFTGIVISHRRRGFA